MPNTTEAVTCQWMEYGTCCTGEPPPGSSIPQRFDHARGEAKSECGKREEGPDSHAASFVTARTHEYEGPPHPARLTASDAQGRMAWLTTAAMPPARMDSVASARAPQMMPPR